MRVAAAAGHPHPPLSDRRESLLDSYKNKSHTYETLVRAGEER